MAESRKAKSILPCHRPKTPPKKQYGQLPRLKNGYRDLAYYMAMKGSPWAIFRKFGQLNMLNLLRLQAELMELQALFKVQCELDDDDTDLRKFAYSFQEMRNQFHEDDSDDQGHNCQCTCQCKADEQPEQTPEEIDRAMRELDLKEQYRLLLKIGNKLKEYNESLLQLAQMEGLESASKQNLTCLRDWLSSERILSAEQFGWKKTFLADEEFFTWCDTKGLKDLIVIQAPDRDAFEQRVSNLLVSIYDFFKNLGHRDGQSEEIKQAIAKIDAAKLPQANGGPVAVPNSNGANNGAAAQNTIRAQKKDVNPPHLRVYRNLRIVAMITSFFAALSAAMIPVISIYGLHQIPDTKRRIFVLMGLTVGFALVFQVLTRAKTTDVFTITAAFVAVLVVFVGSPGDQNTGGRS